MLSISNDLPPTACHERVACSDLESLNNACRGAAGSWCLTESRARFSSLTRLCASREVVDAGVPDDTRFHLTVHAEGPAADDGQIPLAELARIVGGLQVTLERLALSLETGTYAARGPRPREVVEAVRLDFAGFRPGSVIIDITRRGEVETDGLLQRSLQALEDGIAGIRSGDHLPSYFTPQVINGLRELAGAITFGNLTSITFGYSGRDRFVIDSAFREHIRAMSPSTAGGEATVVGRMQMGDFSPATLRCRIDTFAGSVLADFDADLRDTVLDAMDQIVMATGIAELQPDGSTVRLLHLSSLQSLPSARMSPLVTLGRQQGVGPISDLEELQGQDSDDFGPFLNALNSARGR